MLLIHDIRSNRTSEKITAPGFECGVVITGGIINSVPILVATACTESFGSGPAHIKLNGKEICFL